MSAAPYMQFYVADYIGKTMHLTTEQHGAYLLLLIAMWQADASLPNDPAKLARIARVTPKRWGAIWAEISSFFDVADGRIRQERLTKEHQKVLSILQERKTAGSKGGTAKALNIKASALAKVEFCSSIPEPELELEREEKKEEAQAPAKPAEIVRSILVQWAGTEAVASFMAYRSKSRHKALTATAAKRVATHLKAIFDSGGDTDDALAMAEERGWATVEFEWYQNAKGQRNGNGTHIGGGRSGPHNALMAGFAMAADKLKN